MLPTFKQSQLLWFVKWRRMSFQTGGGVEFLITQRQATIDTLVYMLALFSTHFLTYIHHKLNCNDLSWPFHLTL